MACKVDPKSLSVDDLFAHMFALCPDDLRPLLLDLRPHKVMKSVACENSGAA